jgi:(2Fe-2S) ferredoxin
MKQVLICQNRTCRRDGAASIISAFQNSDRNAYAVVSCGCLGLCGSGPIAIVQTDQLYWYYWRIKSQQVALIVRQHLQNGHPVIDLLHPRLHPNMKES